MGRRGRIAGLKAGVVACIMSVGLVSLSTPRVMADSTGIGQTIIQQIVLESADLNSAINTLRMQTGAEVVLLPSDKEYARVTLTLKDRTLDDVLKKICMSAGADVRNDDGVYVVGPKGSLTPPAPVIKPDDTGKAPNPTPAISKPVRTEKIQLRNTRPGDIIFRMSHPEYDVSPDDGDIPFHKQNNNGPKVTTNGGGVMDNVKLLDPGKQTAPVVPTNENPTNTAGGTKNPGDESNQYGGYGGGGYGGQYGGAGGRGYGGGQYGGGQFGGGQFGGGQFGGGQFGGQGAGLFSNIAPDVRVLGYDVDNSLILTGPPDQIADLREIISKLDVAPRQLAIRAEFVEVSVSETRSFGISWSLTRGSFSASTPTSYATGDIVVNYATGNLVTALAAQLSQGRGRTINSPMVTTTNNVPVTFQTGTTIYIPTTQTVVTTGGGAVQGQGAPTQIQVQSGLSVWPRINGDDSITMRVEPFIQNISQLVPNPQGGVLPIINQQDLSVLRRIRNGETMVIGGLIRKNDTSAIKKVPILGDLPLIGSLFQSRTQNLDDSELLIFITPEIIPDEPGAAVTVGGAGGATISGTGAGAGTRP